MQGGFASVGGAGVRFMGSGLFRLELPSEDEPAP